MNYDEKLNQRVLQIPPSGIRKFFDIVSEMPEAISLGVGEPDFITPWDIREAAIKAMKRGFTQYTSNWGLLSLRKLIARYLDERYTLKYDPADEVLVTVGASEAIDLALRAMLNEGEEVIIPEPCYVSYAPSVSLAGGIAVPLALEDKDEFRLTAAKLEAAITPKTKAIILSYPSNPTGGIMEKTHLQAVAEIIKKHDLLVISDEIYSELTYGLKHVSIASLAGMRERTVVINGFSKAFAMTGFRIGYLAAPREMIKWMCRIHQYAIMCAPTFSQFAAVAALEQGFSDNFSAVEEMKAEYDLRRRFLTAAFNDIGLRCFEPRGAFYVFPDISSSGLSGADFAEKLLYAQKVAVVPGSAFSSATPNFVRCSYASSMKNLKIAAERIEKFVNEIK